MKMETLHRAVELGNKLRNIFLATADEAGLPHMASAGRLGLSPKEGRVALGA